MFLGPIFKIIYANYTRLKGTLGFPATLDIELTNNCNLDCIICSRPLMKRKTGCMDRELLKKIILEAKTHPPQSIGLHLFGEPLMHNGLIEMIRIIKDNLKNTKVILSTNAYFLNQNISQALIASGLDIIRFSLDGLDKDTYEKIRAGSNFGQVMNNIKEFIKIRDTSGAGCPFIQMQIIGMKDTVCQAGHFKRFWKPYLKNGDRVIIQEFITFAGRVPDRTRFKIASLRDKLKRRLPCLRLWKNLVIYWDGGVSICCYDYDAELLVGDVNKESISQIWKGERIDAMRGAQLEGRKGKFLLCRTCIRQGS